MEKTKIQNGDKVRVLPLRLWPSKICNDAMYACNEYRNLAGLTFRCLAVSGTFCEIAESIWFPEELLQLVSRGEKINAEPDPDRENPPQEAEEDACRLKEEVKQLCQEIKGLNDALNKRANEIAKLKNEKDELKGSLEYYKEAMRDYEGELHLLQGQMEVVRMIFGGSYGRS